MGRMEQLRSRFSRNVNKVNFAEAATAMQEMRKVSDGVLAAILACNTVADFETYLTENADLIAENKYVGYCRSAKESPEEYAGGDPEKLVEGTGASLWNSHFKWLETMGIYKPDEE